MIEDSRLHPRSVAADALRRGHPAVSRSFRFHRPRGAFCGSGYCGLCEGRTADGRALACEARGPWTWPRYDPVRALGVVAERFPPWFYERGALRHRPALHLLRRLSSAGHLGSSTSRVKPKAWREEQVETAVVGPEGNVDGTPIGVYPGKVLGVVRGDAVVALSFERLVLSTPAYDLPPPVRGNDVPGVIGLRAFETYAEQGAVQGKRVALWGAGERLARAREVAGAHGAEVVWSSDRAPARILGRRKVHGVEADGRARCDLFVSAVAQPALELAVQAGATPALSVDGLPIVLATAIPDWLELKGEGAVSAAGVPAIDIGDDAFVCLCEDVRARDVRQAIARGFDVPELVKRRTGAMTGPCQGKLCSATVLSLLREAGRPHEPTTSRPPALSMSLGELAARA